MSTIPSIASSAFSFFKQYQALCILLVLFTACGTGPITKEGKRPGVRPSTGFFSFFRSRTAPIQNCHELGQWLAKHDKDLVATFERPGLTGELQYRPAACLACMEKRDAAFSDSAFLKRIDQLKATELYVLRIVAGKVSDSTQIELSENMASSFVEVVGRDTFPCSFMHVEATPSMMPYRSALIGFERAQDDKDRRVILLDSEKHLGGDLVMEFPAKGVSRYAAAVPDLTDAVHS
jgi:hypothetical protein